MDDDELDELSDEAIDAEIGRRTKALNADTASLLADVGGSDPRPATLGIEGLSGPELDELIAARSFEGDPTSAKVKAVLAANDAATPHEDEEVPVAPGTFSDMSDSDFAEFVRKRPGVGGGF
jgi:hypothetical protein